MGMASRVPYICARPCAEPPQKANGVLPSCYLLLQHLLGRDERNQRPTNQKNSTRNNAAVAKVGISSATTAALLSKPLSHQENGRRQGRHRLGDCSCKGGFQNKQRRTEREMT